MSKTTNKNKSIKAIYFYFVIIKFIFCQLNECERETPIKIGNQCLSKNCTKYQFEIGECTISNSIIKTQWLNDIILVGEKDFRYINLLTSSKGELLLSTSSCPPNISRIYYGINSDGIPLFKDDNESNIYIIKKNVLRTDNYKRYESVSGLIKINGDTHRNKEYLIDLGKSITYTEIFDFIEYKNNLIEIDNTQTINAETDTYIGSLVNYIENNINFYIFAGIQKISNNNFKILLIKFKFSYDTNGLISCNNIINANFESLDKKIVNCYIKNNNRLICLFISKNYKYKIIILNTNFETKKEQELSISTPSSLMTFFKFLHLKDDIWPLIYYQGLNDDYPIIQFIEIKISESSININLKNSIQLNKYYSNNIKLLTDFSKVRDNLLCVICTNKNKEVLIIILINFYNEMEYNIRYYLINIFELYNHKFLKEFKSAIYNNHIVFAFSFCPQKICNEDEDEHYSSLIFFSYPNTTDYNLDIINYLNKEENNDIIIDLFNNVTIDNNIFGLIIDGIKIYSIDNCGIIFISNITNQPIKNNDTIRENESLELIFTRDEYEITNCVISYKLIITEPDYDEYNKYPNFILKNDTNEKNNFTKYSYEGKVGYFNIFINQNITKDCENSNCKLCSKTGKSNCYLCNNEYNFIGNKKI